MCKKGMMVEYIFLIGGLVLVLLFVSYWQQMGMALASERFGTLKIHTSTQVKNVVLLLQTAPVSSETCIPITGCDKIALHGSYVEIWGKENEYFKEPSYLSTALSGKMLDLYEINEKGELEKVGDMGFITYCGPAGSTFMVCLRSQYLEASDGKGDYAQDSANAGFFHKAESGKGAYKKILVVTTQTDLTPAQVSG